MLLYLEKGSLKIKHVEIRSSCIIWVGPKSNDKCPLKRKAEGGLRQKRRRHGRGENHVKMEVGVGVLQPQAKEHLEPPKAGSGRRECGLHSP